MLTHGYLVSHDNVHRFVEYISVELNKFENGVAEYMKALSNVSHQLSYSLALAFYLHFVDQFHVCIVYRVCIMYHEY